MNTDTYEHLKLDNQICHRLYMASNALTRMYRPLLAELGLSYPQYIIMMGLWEKDKISLGELASVTYMDKGFLTSLINKLKESEFVEIIHDSEDKRKKIIKLTAKGSQLKQKAKCIPEQMFCQLEQSDIEGLEAFKSELDKFLKLIKLK